MFCVWVVYLNTTRDSHGAWAPFQSNHAERCVSWPLKCLEKLWVWGKDQIFFAWGDELYMIFFCMYSSPSVLGDEKQQDKSWACWDRRFLNWIWWIYFIYWSHILGSIISLEKPSKLSIEHSNTLPSFLSFSSHFCPVISSDFCENGSPTFGVAPILSRFRIEPLEIAAVESSTDTSTSLSRNQPWQ